MVQIKQLKEASVFSVHFVQIYPKKNKRIKIIFQYLMINLLVWKSVFLFGRNEKDKLHDTGNEFSVSWLLPRILDIHTFGIAVIGVQNHVGNLVNWERQDTKRHDV